MVSCFFTMHCASLLLETRKKLEADSFAEIGEKLFGRLGRALVDICLIASQTGFCCAYVFFIKRNYAKILESQFDWDVDENVIAILCFIGFTLLAFVRKIEVFAKFHLFADIMIVLTITVIVIYGSIELAKTGNKVSQVPFINSETYTDAIGFSVYCFEGIGVILPV